MFTLYLQLTFSAMIATLIPPLICFCLKYMMVLHDENMIEMLLPNHLIGTFLVCLLTGFLILLHLGSGTNNFWHLALMIAIRQRAIREGPLGRGRGNCGSTIDSACCSLNCSIYYSGSCFMGWHLLCCTTNLLLIAEVIGIFLHPFQVEVWRRGWTKKELWEHCIECSCYKVFIFEGDRILVHFVRRQSRLVVEAMNSSLVFMLWKNDIVRQLELLLKIVISHSSPCYFQLFWGIKTFKMSNSDNWKPTDPWWYQCPSWSGSIGFYWNGN